MLLSGVEGCGSSCCGVGWSVLELYSVSWHGGVVRGVLCNVVGRVGMELWMGVARCGLVRWVVDVWSVLWSVVE